MKNRLSVIGYRLLGIRENKVKGNEFRVQVLNRLIIIDLNSPNKEGIHMWCRERKGCRVLGGSRL
jgi:hypothetical protein